MSNIINIGLHFVFKGIEYSNSVSRVTRALKTIPNLDIIESVVRQSNTEPTFIATLSRPLSHLEAYWVSEELDQDCIAQYANGIGRLYGPKAEEWGQFNPDYFLFE